MKVQSIQLKVIAGISLLMFVGMATIIPITVNRQREDLLQASKNTLSVNTDMLNLVIRNIMLSGEAPIAVETMESLRQIPEFKELDVYRSTGERAFQDFSTLDFVNSIQDYITFQGSQRVEEGILLNPAFQDVIERGRPVSRELTDDQDMEYLFPLRNERACWDCHGSVDVSGSLRGVAHFKISIADVYVQMRQTSLLLASFLGGVVLLFAFLLIIIIRKIVLQPLLHIGQTVSQFGNGDTSVKVNVKSHDELGRLAEQINSMFSSVAERLHLAKYVSRSTNKMIQRSAQNSTQEDHLNLDGQKEDKIVLFSDIRGFTKFADTADPQTVVTKLNAILDIQARIIESYNGDIDKFMGDAVMALFDDAESAVKAAMVMVKKCQQLSKSWDKPLYIGVGLNSGELITGNIGSHDRLEYAVIGDTVNLASRLCGVAPPNSVLISESLYFLLQDKLVVKAVENQTIKGKAKPITYYAVKHFKNENQEHE